MKRILTLVLALLMILTFVACQAEENTEGTTTTTTTTPKRTDPIDPGTDPEGEEDEGYDVDVYIPYGTPVVDGVRDPIWDTAVPCPLELIMMDAPQATVTAYSLWDNEHLYFFFDIKDADVAQDGTEGDWHNDGIYLYISEDNNFGISSFDQYSGGTYQFAIINEELTLLPRKGEDNIGAENYQVSVNIVEDGITIEFGYKPQFLTMEGGSQFTLDYQYNDCTSGATRLGCLSWYRMTDGDASPMSMGIAQLVAEGESIPQD